MPIEAVVFDMDGVIVDSEEVWHSVRNDFVAAHGGRWTEGDQTAVMGANSAQWSAYIRDNCGVSLDENAIYRGVVDALKARYRESPPLIDGARDVILRLADRFPLAIASSSSTELIRYVLDLANLSPCFDALVSSDEAEKGKPAPDVYLIACRKLNVDAGRSVAVEDSNNGIQSAAAAGMTVVAIPNRWFPPAEETVKLAALVLRSICRLTPDVLESLGLATASLQLL